MKIAILFIIIFICLANGAVRRRKRTHIKKRNPQIFFAIKCCNMQNIGRKGVRESDLEISQSTIIGNERPSVYNTQVIEESPQEDLNDPAVIQKLQEKKKHDLYKKSCPEDSYFEFKDELGGYDCCGTVTDNETDPVFMFGVPDNSVGRKYCIPNDLLTSLNGKKSLRRRKRNQKRRKNKRRIIKN